jgi:hypothetical protein
MLNPVIDATNNPEKGENIAKSLSVWSFKRSENS